MVDLTQLLTGVGGVALGFVGAVTGREARFNKRIDDELEVLRKEVALCRQERTEFEIVKVGVNMLLPEMRRIQPENPVMLAVAAAFEVLPITSDMQTLIAQLTMEHKDERGTAADQRKRDDRLGEVGPGA